MPEYINAVEVIEQQRHRRRTNCRLCGERVEHGQSFYTDGYTTEHMDCYLAFSEVTE